MSKSKDFKDPEVSVIRQAESSTSSKNWKEALFALLASRGGVLKIEGRKAVSDLFLRLALLLVAAIGLLFCWILAMLGLVGVLSLLTPMNWWQSSFAVAGGHLLIASVLFLIARSIGSTPFPVSRQEFEKDCEWLKQLKQRPKSQS